MPSEQTQFAHKLVDLAAVDMVHGHSSHHPKGIEVRCGKLILYGCGDFINDYEGISSHEQFRGDLGVMYFPRLDDASGVLNAEGERFGSSFDLRPGSRFTLAAA